MTKTILITGASSGIGAACAKMAAAEGHNLVLAARSKDKLDALVAEIGDDKALAVECDVSDGDSQRAMFDKAIERFGSLDVVFANAGFGMSVTGDLDQDIPQFRDMILTNCFGLTLTCKLAQPHLEKSKGHLVMTGSRAAHVALPGSVYGATKWFVDGFARNMHAAASGTGMRVTNIEPGMVDTPFFDSEKPDALRDDDIARAFIYAISQPAHVNVLSVQVNPVS